MKDPICLAVLINYMSMNFTTKNKEVANFLKTYELYQLNKERGSLNASITNREIESVPRNFPTRKCSHSLALFKTTKITQNNFY